MSKNRGILLGNNGAFFDIADSTPGNYLTYGGIITGSGTLTMSELAEVLGWYSVPLPEVALKAAAELVADVPFMPAQAQWIEAIRRPVLMDTSKARRELRWRLRHDARETLREMVDAARTERLIHKEHEALRVVFYRAS